MSISIKTAREIEKMRRAGELLEKVHDELGRAIHPGMSTWEINKLGEEMIRSFDLRFCERRSGSRNPK